MTATQNRLYGLIAIIWGLCLIYFYASLRVAKYLAEDFHVFVLIGGLGVTILGLFVVLHPTESVEKSCCGHDHDHHEDHDHGGCEHDHHDHSHCNHSDHDHSDCDHHHEDSHTPLTTALITLIPLLLAMTYSPDRFSVEGVTRLAEAAPPTSKAPFTLEDLEKNVSKNNKGQFQISLIDAYFSGSDREVHPVLRGVPVEMEGRLMPEKTNNADGSRRRVFRTFISCCAADATVAGVSLVFNTPLESADLPDNTWVKVGGTLDFEEINGKTRTILNVTDLTEAPEPYAEFIQRRNGP